MVIKAVVTTIFCAISFVVLYPLVCMVSAAFSPGVGIASVNIIPFADGFTIEHFGSCSPNPITENGFAILSLLPFQRRLSRYLSLRSEPMFFAVPLCHQEPMLMSYPILQIFPSFVGMVAIYVILLRIKGLDTLWGWCLCTSRGIFLITPGSSRTTWIRSSKSLDEAARIDGESFPEFTQPSFFPWPAPSLPFSRS